MAGALAAIMAAGITGYTMGSRANEAKHVRNIVKLAEEMNRKEVERLAMQAVIDAQAQALEDASYAAEPDDPVLSLPAARVRRLNAR
jgi:hypothetical protein